MAKVYFYYSAMNAGKTTTLLQSSHNYRERGMETLLFTPEIDNRYQTGVIHSRIGLKQQATTFTESSNLFEITRDNLNGPLSNLKCVLVDEAHFLSKAQVLQLTDVADVLNIPVLTYGIRSDFRGEPFEGSLYLLIWAEELIEIKTICHCGRKATMVLRLDAHGKPIREGEQTFIGGNESYVSTCRKHFKLGQTGA